MEYRLYEPKALDGGDSTVILTRRWMTEERDGKPCLVIQDQKFEPEYIDGVLKCFNAQGFQDVVVEELATEITTTDEFDAKIAEVEATLGA